MQAWQGTRKPTYNLMVVYCLSPAKGGRESIGGRATSVTRQDRDSQVAGLMVTVQ